MGSTSPGIGVPKATEALYLAFFHNITGDTYIAYRLWRFSSIEEKTRFVQADEWRLVQELTFGGTIVSKLHDKFEFHQLCELADIPTAKLVGVFREGNLIEKRWDGSLPPVNLFQKPTRENCGKGARLWIYKPQIGDGSA